MVIKITILNKTILYIFIREYILCTILIEINIWTKNYFKKQTKLFSDEYFSKLNWPYFFEVFKLFKKILIVELKTINWDFEQ